MTMSPTAAVAEVLTDASLAGSLVERGGSNWQRFSWDRCAAGLVDVYRRALSDKHHKIGASR